MNGDKAIFLLCFFYVLQISIEVIKGEINIFSQELLADNAKFSMTANIEIVINATL